MLKKSTKGSITCTYENLRGSVPPRSSRTTAPTSNFVVSSAHLFAVKTEAQDCRSRTTRLWKFWQLWLTSEFTKHSLHSITVFKLRDCFWFQVCLASFFFTLKLLHLLPLNQQQILPGRKPLLLQFAWNVDWSSLNHVRYHFAKNCLGRSFWNEIHKQRSSPGVYRMKTNNLLGGALTLTTGVESR